MPITKSAKKAMNRSQKLEARNKDFKIKMKMAMKKFTKSIEKGESVTLEQLSHIFKRIDKCLKVGILKPRNAARKKARMSKMFHAAQSK
ncbi:MAG: 30S ribosomal protein S20 [Candidatus Absconditabacteria bacterium]|nr:30S ribosomal protein S20 [Candidatus Absconditabacteria bacterium]MDD4713914.1 30S ribosomal protein S20 [Candidatus Absconditabacteria bacterium]